MLTLPDTESFTIPAPGASGDLRIDVALPADNPEVGRPRTAGPLPVLLLLDGNYLFPWAYGTSRSLGLIGEAAQHLLVAVSYPDGDRYPRFNERRAKDFTRPQDADGPLAAMNIGGAEAFLAALVDNLLPALARRYNVQLNGIFLYGTSLGGYFTAQALLADKGSSFAGFGMLSGAFGYAPDLLDALRALRQSDLSPHIKLLVQIGADEELSPLFAHHKLVTHSKKLIEAWRNAGLDFEGEILPGETHASVFGPAFSRALRFFFPPSPQ